MPTAVRSAVKSLIVAGLLAIVVVYHVGRFPVTQSGIDFPEFYCAAKIILSGGGHQLYDVHAQQRFQMRYTGRVGVIFNHPPFETLLYLPSALLPYTRGYLLWTIVSTLLLALAALLLTREAGIFRDSGMVIMLCFVFAPLQLDVMQGQDDGLLLLIYVLVYIALRRGRLFTAGAILALGLLKPQLVLPAFLILLIAQRRWKFCAGFAALAALLGLVSLAISGSAALLAYPSFVLSLSRVHLAGYHPGNMANGRGLISLLSLSSSWQALLLVGGSIALGWLGIHAFGIRVGDSTTAFNSGQRGTTSSAAFDLAFANLVMIALLVSYHLSPHDLTLLLIPMALIARHLREAGIRRDPIRIAMILLLLILFLPPLHIIALAYHTYAWIAIPVLVLCITATLELHRASRAERDVHIQHAVNVNAGSHT